MCAISDIEISNDNEGGSISGSNRSSNEDESENQGKDENNNNNNFVVKFRSRESENQVRKRCSVPVTERIASVSEMREPVSCSFSFLPADWPPMLPLSNSSQQHKGEREQCHGRIWEKEYNYSKTGSEESSGTSSQGNDGGTNVLAEFRFLHGGSNLGGGPPDSITKKPRAHLAVAVPSTGNAITGESTFLLTPTTAASVSALLDDEDDDETTTNSKADNDNKTDHSDSDSAANPTSPEQQEESPSTEETTGAPGQEASQQSSEDQQSESAEDTATTAGKDSEPNPAGNTIFRLATATTTTTLQSSQQIDGPEPLATLGLQRIISLDLTGGSETSSVVGRILLSLLSGAVDKNRLRTRKRKAGVRRETMRQQRARKATKGERKPGKRKPGKMKSQRESPSRRSNTLKFSIGCIYTGGPVTTNPSNLGRQHRTDRRPRRWATRRQVHETLA
ncbi:hypothetical protein PG996_002804 [Apiospora saccharicola]|uniref:Uncharacterized protein n=1 Tax=Apiospora saccharicola TaxID=335842 RepID=A0ABR1WKN7_9PEZI